MATFSSNVTIKIQAAVLGSASNSSSTLYTAPANSYAVLNLFVVASGSAGDQVTVGGNQVWNGGVATRTLQLYVGPGQAVATVYGGSPTFTAHISGAEFKNSP